MAALTPREAADPKLVQVETTAKLLDELGKILPVRTTLRYKPTDPFAVTLVFPAEVSGGEEVCWSFGRDLLDAGLKDWAGQGDVRIWSTDTGTVHIKLSSPEGDALFEFDKKVLREFVRATYAEVPRNKESKQIDMDRVIQRILLST